MTYGDWIYIVGYLWTMRYALGFTRTMVDETNYGDSSWDTDDMMYFGFGAVVSAFVCLAWPALLAGRLLYRGVMMVNVSGHGGVWEKIMPAPKKVESRAQKQARKQRERDEENRMLKRRITELERETGVGREPAGH